MYPKWKYHAEKPAVMVRSAEEEKALGVGWAESPAVFVEKVGEPSSKEPAKKPSKKPKVSNEEIRA